MQSDDPGLKSKAQEVYRRLVAVYGLRERKLGRDPMRQLISTMLSHRTTWRNEKLAFDRMWARYGDWEAVRLAPLAELIALISPSTFPEVKAPNIQKTLTRILEDRGEYNLDFLAALPSDEALAWLLSLPGVGIKTASLLLLFNFGKPVIPVDTHVHRVSGRLGLIPPKATAEAAHRLLLDLLPREAAFLYNFHVSMLKHGQQVCVWGTPRCERCPLTGLCDWYQAERSRNTSNDPTPDAC